MDRIKPGGYSALIEAAYALIPDTLHQLIRPHFLCGTDPVFAGLHRFEAASYGRSYRGIAHVTYNFHQSGLPRSSRRTTIVLPQVISVASMVHEFGHVLDESIGFDHDAVPITAYAQTDRAEAFAEAFAAWVVPGYVPWAVPDAATLALLEGIADVA